ncbi:MAG: hypothetical protein K2W96_21460 [Gemmataceae bacterium]|nr:hypothetical protein [Gemmataceae bacterium]
MAYRFTGFFARPALALPSALPAGAVWRPINEPFSGIGVQLPVAPTTEEDVIRLLQAVGLGAVEDWIFLDYVCWGGQIDFVHGFGVRGGRAFGPIRSADDAQRVYLHLMRSFGIDDSDAMAFTPFRRGFWGED